MKGRKVEEKRRGERVKGGRARGKNWEKTKEASQAGMGKLGL